jgi:opacity protein-like surface antigen
VKQCSVIVVATAWLVATAGSAAAADIYGAPPTAEGYAASGFYLRGDAGFSWLDVADAHADSAIAGGGLGYEWNPMFRTDVRFDHAFDYARRRDTNVSLSTITANGYLDLPVSSVLKPYVGGGIGYGFVNSDFHDGALVTALMGGVSFDVNQYVVLDVGYRFRTYFDPEDLSNHDVHDHSVTAGVRFRF